MTRPNTPTRLIPPPVARRARKPLAVLAFAATLTASLAAPLPAHAGTADTLGDRLQPNVSLYLKVPFGAGTRGQDWQRRWRQSWRAHGEYGLRIGITRFQGSYEYGWRPRAVADLAAFRFTATGPDRISLSGRDFYLRHGTLTLNADGTNDSEDGQNGGDKTGKWLLIGLGTAGVLVGVAALAAKDIADGPSKLAACLVDVPLGQPCPE